jgi:3-oxoadipate enol-lactonase
MHVRVNDIDIHYQIDGQGPWLVLSHSLACDLSMWDEQVDHFKANYRVLRFDTRGHGASSAPAGAYSLDTMAADLHGLLAALDVQRPNFVGLSMGGMIGQTYALNYPGQLRSLVIADSSGRVPAEAQSMWQSRGEVALSQGMEPHVEPTLVRWFTEPFRRTQPAQIERIAKLIRATAPAGYAGCCEAIRRLDVLDRLGEIRCPALVIVGEQDAGTPVAMSQAINQQLPGSELVILPNAAHLSNVEQAAAFNRALADFLARHN